MRYTRKIQPPRAQPDWKRSFRVGRRRFTSRRCLELRQKDDCFRLGDKWISFRELPLVLEAEIDAETRYFHAERDGERVLALYEDVPIFDSGDSKYDSVHKAYIKRVGGELCALYIGNGWALSTANLYLCVQPENDDAAQALRLAGLGDRRLDGDLPAE